MAKTTNTKSAAETKETKKGEITMTAKKTTKAKAPKTEKKEIEQKKEVLAIETKVVEKKENAKKTNNAVPQLTNDQLKELFTMNGCATYTKASNESKVVYNTFGTRSRILQQGKAYQLLLTNGHADKKGLIIETDNDDTARFVEWYNGLTDEQKKWVNGFEDIYKTKLAASEMPRERTVKITNYELLCEFIRYMATFSENQVAAK